MTSSHNRVSPAVGQILGRAHACLQQGRREEAEDLYRGILAGDSFQPEALCGLAAIALSVGQGRSALRLMERAAVTRSHDAALWNEIAATRFSLGDLDGARAAFRLAVALAPHDAQYIFHLGVTERDAGNARRSTSCLARAALIAPDHPFALSDLAAGLQASGNLAAAEAAFRRLLALDPVRPLGWHNYGILANETHREDFELLCYRRAITADDQFIPSLYNLGGLALSNRQYQAATSWLRQTLCLAPDHAGAWNNLGCVQREQIMPEKSLSAFRRGYAAAPNDRHLGSNMAMALSAREGSASDEFVRRWGRQFPLQARAFRKPTRGRLRIGYVSGDFRHHSCAYFIEPLFAEHDRERVEIFAYSDVDRPDRHTEKLSRLVDHWRAAHHLKDADLAAAIAADQIDILVDLTGHTGTNRLRVFATKSASVQVSWLGYNATTGLPQIDWKLADHWIAPGPKQEWFAEGLWRLPRLAHCWRPPSECPTPRPVARTNRPGEVVFGSFNALHKLSAETLELWGRILATLPNAKLHLKGGAGLDPTTRRNILTPLVSQGVSESRIVITGWNDTTRSHLESYHEIDIALDPFPYNGTTTTCEALWMGVPVVTLAGDRMISRIGISLLTAVGLDDLIAETRDDYVRIAATLAADADRRNFLHGNLRHTMSASPLRDERGFARTIEDAFFRMALGEEPPPA